MPQKNSPHGAEKTKPSDNVSSENSTTMHRKAPRRSVVQAVQDLPTTSERLRRARYLVGESIRGLKEPNAMFFQADFSPEELDWICTELGTGLAQAQTIDQQRTFLDEYSVLFLAALTNAGSHLTEELAFWPHFWKQLGHDPTQPLESHIRRNLKSWLQQAHLEAFQRVKITGMEYVTIATLHAGIPTKELKILVNDCRELLEVDDKPEDGDREGELLVNGYITAQHPLFLSRLSSYKRDLAQNLFARIIEYVYYTQVCSDWYVAPFEGTHGLPQKIFSELRQFLRQMDESGEVNYSQGSGSTIYRSSSSTRSAREICDVSLPLELDIDMGRVVLQLPETRYTGESLRWHVDTGFETQTVVPNPEPARRLWESAEFTIEGPAEFIEVSAVFDGKRIEGASKTVPFLDPSFPVAFFGRSGAYSADQSTITSQSSFVLAPMNTEFSDAMTGRAILPQETYPLEMWAGWYIYLLTDLNKLRGLTLTLPDEDKTTTRQVRCGKSRSAEWFEEEGKIPDVFGLNYQPVYAVSPKLSVPWDEASQWTMNIVYLDPTGERELVLEDVDLTEFQESPTEIFSDEFNDAWVGHYEVTVLRSGLIESSRRFNIAEGCTVKVDYRGQHFRYPDVNVNENSYSKNYFEFVHTGSKTVTADINGPAAIDRTSESARLRLSNPNGFILEVLVIPKCLEYSIPTSTQQARWSTFPSTFGHSELNREGSFKVRFPVPVLGPIELLAIEGRRNIKRFSLNSSRGKQLFSLPIREILSEFPGENRNLTLTLRWQLQSFEDVWKSGNIIKSGSWNERKAEYENWGTPHSTSTLARISNAQFQGTATIGDETIILHGNRLSKKNLTAFVWPLTQLTFPPKLVKFDINNRSSIPSDFQGAGPLVIEFVDAHEGYSPSAPARPSSYALVADQASFMADTRSADAPMLNILALQLSPLAKPTPVSSQRRMALWEELALASKLPSFIKLDGNRRILQRPVSHRYEVAEATIREDARDMLTALGRSNVRLKEQPAAAIQFGLVNHSFNAQDDTSNQFNPVPWVGVLEELNDVCTLASHGVGSLDESKKQELEESLEYLNKVGDSSLQELLQGEENTQLEFLKKIINDVEFGVIQDDFSNVIPGLSQVTGDRDVAGTVALRLGWAELLTNRTDTDYIEDFESLKKVALGVRRKIHGEAYGDYMQELKTFATDWSAPSAEARSQWPWIPFISMVLAHAARASVHLPAKSGIHSINTKHRIAWARVAEIAPTLVTYDLVRAEARYLGLAHSPLSFK